jgi:hypothetical protein
MSGWIKLHRQLMDNPLYFSEPFSRTQAWIDLLLLANHKENYFFKRGIKVNVSIGQVGYDMDSLGKRWQWSRGKVERFILHLEKEGNIVRQKNNVSTLISIVKYSEYQSDSKAKDKPNDKPNGHQTANQTDTNKNENNNKNEKNEKEILFEQFWNLYDNKQDRVKSEKKFMSLDLPVIEKIINVVPLYTNITTTDKVNNPKGLKFRKNPLTWLNGECWNDEIKETDKKEEGYTLANGTKMSTNFAF